MTMKYLKPALYTLGVLTFGFSMGVEVMARQIIQVMNWQQYSPVLQPEAAAISGYYRSLTIPMLAIVAASLLGWVYLDQYHTSTETTDE